MTTKGPSIVWFRQDLRTADHPALNFAAARGPVIPVFVWDDTESERALGAASRWWLHHSLSALRESLGGLVLLRGQPARVLPDLARRTSASAVSWNRRYEPQERVVQQALHEALRKDGIIGESFPGSVLWEPGRVRTLEGEPFKVFTPFWRGGLRTSVAEPLGPPPIRLHPWGDSGETLEDWKLLPTRPDWARKFAAFWHPGERGAQETFRSFLSEVLLGYGELRNRPDQAGVSRLSPHLHFGEISPRQLWADVHALMRRDRDFEADGNKFLQELGWREFSYQLLFDYPDLPVANWRRAFDRYPWVDNDAQLRMWQRGLTGYPFVDAGMRELWHTGYMHNRVRMVAASFLIKHLRIDWRKGEQWFWDTLVDADLANNAASWQWVAGSGTDAAPYFRIFSPIEQGRKFDPEGDYVRRWCPELAALPTQHLHAPFAAPAEVLQAAGVRLGDTYPQPLVEHRAARAAALEGYEKVRNDVR